MTTTILLIISQAQLLVNLEEHDVFKPALVLHQQEDRVLLCSAVGNLVLLFDRSWKLLARYDQAGPGPNELEKPIIFGMTGQTVLLLNRYTGFLELDRSLRPTGQELPPYPNGLDVRMGVHLAPDRFLVLGRGMGPFLAWAMVLAGDEWQASPGVFPKGESQAMFNKLTYLYHNGLMFVADSPFKDLKPGDPPESLKNPVRYEIAVHDVRAGPRENLVQILSHPIDGLPEFDTRLLALSGVFKRQNKYLVFFSFVDFPERWDRDWINYLDTYAENGDFLGRQPVEPHWRYLPIHGSDQVVRLNSETMELFAFSPE